MTVNGLPIQAVVDTGAEATVISEEVYNMLPVKGQKPLSQTSLRNAGVGKRMAAMGGLDITLQIGSQTFIKEVYVCQIHDSFLLGLDVMKDADIYAGGKVFIGDEPVPARTVGGYGPDYTVSRALLEGDTTLPPESECLVWGKVDQPKPGVPTILEPLNITEAVSSGSVAIHMDPRVPVRLCNFSSTKAALPRGVCLGILIETFPDDPPLVSDSVSEQIQNNSEEESSEAAKPQIGRVAVRQTYQNTCKSCSQHQAKLSV